MTPAEKQVNDFESRTLSKNFGDLVQTVFLDILTEHHPDRPLNDAIAQLPLGYLITCHQIQFKLAQRAAIRLG
jgi:hypothetical protein